MTRAFAAAAGWCVDERRDFDSIEMMSKYRKRTSIKTTRAGSSLTNGSLGPGTSPLA
jgi:hypothetical protein